MVSIDKICPLLTLGVLSGGVEKREEPIEKYFMKCTDQCSWYNPNEMSCQAASGGIDINTIAELIKKTK